MALKLTDNAVVASEQIGKKPQLVLQIEGVTTLFGALKILKYAKIGDPDLYFDGSWLIGGFIEHHDQEDLISFDGTGTKVNQQLLPDKGAVSSVSSISIALLDSRNQVTKIISPGKVIEDILGTKCKLYMGFQTTAYPEDYVEVFSGFVDDVESGAGTVKINLAHPDQKKRQEIYPHIKVKLAEALSDVATSVKLTSTSGLLTPVTGPQGVVDSSVSFYVKVGTELISYTGISGNTLTGCTRGLLGTPAIPHEVDVSVESFYVLEGDVMALALKLMLSGWQGPFISDISAHSFNQISATEEVENSLFFKDVKVSSQYGIVEGDFVSISGSSNAANNVSEKEILIIEETELGSYITLDGVSFVTEPETSAVCSFRSKYDVLPDGLRMAPDEVDVTAHERIRTLFLAGFGYQFYLKNSLDGKKFLEEEIYNPAACYAIPRKGKASVGIHAPPLPFDTIATVDKNVIKNPSQIKLRRTLGRHFTNTINYSWDESVLGNGLLSAKSFDSSESKDRIKIGTRALQIESKGMRSLLQAEANAFSSASNRLNRYRFAAEHFENIDLLYGSSFAIEVGDIVLVDFDGLHVSNTEDGDRKKKSKLFEVINRSLDIKSGQVSVALVDTSFDGADRYGLISPASKVRSGISTTQFIIKESFASRFGPNEWRKWRELLGAAVIVRSEDFSRSANSFIESISSNTVKLSSALPFTPQADDIMELAGYDLQPESVRLLYTFMSDAEFSDNKPQYKMI